MNSLTFKIFTIVGLLVFCTAATGVLGLYRFSGSIERYQAIVQEDIVNERDAKQALLGFKTQIQEWKIALLRGADSAQRNKHWSAFKAHEQEVISLATALLERMEAGDAKERLQSFKTTYQAMSVGYQSGFDAFIESGFQPTVADSAVAGMDRAPEAILVELAGYFEAKIQQDVEHEQEAFGPVMMLSFSMLLAVSIAGLILSGWLARSLTRQIGGDPTAALEAVQKISQGEMSTAVALRASDQTSIMAGVENMRESLVGVVRQVRNSSDSIASGSAEIATVGAEQSGRIEQLASSIEQTAASMEQLGSTVAQNATHAEEANDLAKTASSVAQKGGVVVSDVVNTMQEINESSQKIVDIIAVIDSIAFQTNLLALNAAVEAARAGEEGRGFAVVASEVRALAHRSSDAANEIKQLITDSVEKVERGGELVDRAGSTMNDVVSSIVRVTELMGEISYASHEQSTAVAEVGQAVSAMDATIQQSTSMVRESATAAASLKNQSDDLVQAVSSFKVD